MKKPKSLRAKDGKSGESVVRLPRVVDLGRVVMTAPARLHDEALLRMQLEVASYIEEISIELGAMAKAAQLGSLAYFIDMTRLEAAIHRRTCRMQLDDVIEPDLPD